MSRRARVTPEQTEDQTGADRAELSDTIGPLVDAAWYLERYPEIARAHADPVQHFIRFGADEGRDPNPFFDGAWYLRRYPDVAELQVLPLLHYIQNGAAELRDPHPRFDAAYYAGEHPEAAGNPMIFHLLVGAARGWPTRRRQDIGDYLPSSSPPLPVPADLAVDVIIPAYRGLAQTRRCLASVLADRERPLGRVIVIDDASPEPKLSAYLDKLAASGAIELVRNSRNMGFVSSANRGMLAADPRDVVLLNSDTEVPPGWLRRLAAQAHAGPRIATVSPLSNNATICGYPTLEGSGPAFGMSAAAIDAVAREVNAGRHVDVPVTVGSCMYIRRAAIRETGLFDAQAFGRGYGEEVDFCMRAHAAGWHHRLATDVFVFHEGQVSFGGDAPEQRGSQETLLKKYPGYARNIDGHVREDAAGPSRWALTAALLARSKLPLIAMVSHGLGGGVGIHIDALVERLADRAHFVTLEGGAQGVRLSVPSLPGHPATVLPSDRTADLVTLLRSMGVARAHVHQTMGLEMNLRALLHGLGVPTDVTVHDWHAICPQVNLLPQLDGQYCGEPEPAVCNACIAARPSHGAADILSWRRTHTWLLREADRVICPSEDARRRLARYGLADRAIVAAHEPVERAPWPIAPPPALQGRKLRLAVLGVLADQKGAHTVAAVADAADPAELEITVIGYAETALPTRVKERVKETGRYEPRELPRLIARARPHAIWFPAQWPETYSYTLSAAIRSGLPILATDIGAFTERLAGRPQTWLAAASAPAAAWLEVIDRVRDEVSRGGPPPRGKPRPVMPDFYADAYVLPKAKPSGAPGLIDARRPRRTTVLVIPEIMDTLQPSPCAFIRLLLPLDHPAIGEATDAIVADAGEALRYRPDIIATQRYAVPDIAAADSLRAHCDAHGITLLYDLDDDLLNVPRDHAEADMLRSRAKLVRRMIGHANAVWVSTERLRVSLAPVRDDARVVANGLDERLWSVAPAITWPPQGPLRILMMGTGTHQGDYAIVAPALERLADVFGRRVSIDMIGVTPEDTPPFINRITPPHQAAATYGGFVNWITHQPSWHVGLVPLAADRFNDCKSSIKTLDFAALGMAVLASDVPAYAGSLAAGPGGMLVENTAAAWYAALSGVLRDPQRWRRMAEAARAAYLADGTLAAQAGERRAMWRALAARAVPAARRRA